MFKKRTYLDFASITPVSKKVNKEIKKIEGLFFNPSSLYKEGVEVKKVIEEVRKGIAMLLRSHSDEIFFTGGGTESNNIAICGVYKKIKEDFKRNSRTPHIIVSTIEHSSVLECVRALEKDGVKVTYISPEKDGIVDSKKVKEAITKDTFIISIQYVNNEIGTIQRLDEVAKAIHHFKKHNSSDVFPLFHTDACQAFNYLDINVLKIHVDLLTLDGSKVYGPHGTGLLFVKRNTPIESVLYGGGQENNLRSGTENVWGIFGLKIALEESEKRRKKESERQMKLQTYFFERLRKEIPNSIINGSIEERVSGNVNFGISGLNSEFALFELDARGVMVSTASSCLNNKEESFSYVVKEINPGLEKSSLRVSFGVTTTKRDIDRFFKAFLATNSYKETIGI